MSTSFCWKLQSKSSWRNGGFVSIQHLKNPLKTTPCVSSNPLSVRKSCSWNSGWSAWRLSDWKTLDLNPLLLIFFLVHCFAAELLSDLWPIFLISTLIIKESSAWPWSNGTRTIISYLDYFCMVFGVVNKILLPVQYNCGSICYYALLLTLYLYV